MLGISICIGVAGAASGLYLYGIILPSLLLWRSGLRPEIKTSYALGALFFGSWCLFPLTNALQSLWPAGEAWLMTSVQPLELRQILSSKLSSTWGATGLALLVLGGISQWEQRSQSSLKDEPNPDDKPVPRAQPERIQPQSLLTSFAYGLCTAACLLAVYTMIQHLFGYDYRRPDQLITQNNLMGQGRYRAFGVYGHPLTVASVGLALLAYFSSLWFNLKTKVAAHTDTAPEAVPEPTPDTARLRVACVIIAVAAIVLILCSGSRMPLFISIAWLVGLGAYSMRARFKLFKQFKRFKRSLNEPGAEERKPVRVIDHRWARLNSVGTAVLGTFATLGTLALGSWLLRQRLGELFTSLAAGDIWSWPRITFWQVHSRIFADFPLFGAGSAHLSHYMRDAYYAELGHGMLAYKGNAHNIYLETLCSLGLLASCVLLFCIVQSLRMMFARPSKQASLERALVWPASFALLVNGLHGLTQNVFFDASVLCVYMALFWVHYWVGTLERAQP